MKKQKHKLIQSNIHEHTHHHNPDCGCENHNHEEGGCSCGCEHEKEASKISIILLIVSVILVIISLFKMPDTAAKIIGIAAVVFSAYPVIILAGKSIIKLSIDETVLMTISVIAASVLGDFREAAAVAILYRIGEFLEDKATDRSRDSISSLSKIQADFANLVMPDGTVIKTDAKDVQVGSTIIVYPFEKFPVDGVVASGISTADVSAITGESLPINLSKGSEVLSGSVNGESSLQLTTTAVLADSTASRIISMVESASKRKGSTQRIITKFAKVYTPIVVAGAVILAVVPSIVTGNWDEWIYRALVLLVASCPCALVLSIPLGFFSGLGSAARKGILVKGGKFVESTAQAKAVVFDKTGTLTDGEIRIEKLMPDDGFTDSQLLTLAGAAEYHSTHPIAVCISHAAPDINENLLADFREVPGYGSSVLFCGKQIFCGNKRLLDLNSIKYPEVSEEAILVAVEDRFAGAITVGTKERAEAKQAILNLRAQGIKKVFMLTGDNEKSAHRTAVRCSVDEYHSALLPQEKLEWLNKIKAEYGKVIYVGDGINDAPVLAAADTGVAMGIGSQAATQAADMILTNNNLLKLAQAHKLFKKTMLILNINIIFALLVKLIVVILGILGMAPVWLAVLADVGVCIICVISSSLIGADSIFSALKNLFEDIIKK